MLRWASPRHIAGCRKILSSSSHHVTKGLRCYNVLRPTAATQQMLRMLDCRTDRRPLLPLQPKCFSSTEIVQLEDTNDVNSKTDGGDIQNVFKLCAIENYDVSFSYADDRKLYVRMKGGKRVSRKDFKEMSSDIIDVYQRAGENFAVLRFRSEEDAEKNKNILSEMDIFDVVNYVGTKMTTKADAQNAKRLRLTLANSSVTKEDVENMAEGLVQDVNMVEADNSLAYLHFDSEEDTIKAFKKLKQDSRVTRIALLGGKIAQLQAGKLTLRLEIDEGVTEEDLLKLSDDILDVRITSDRKKAYLDFGSEEITEKNYVHFKKNLRFEAQFCGEKFKDLPRTLWMSIEEDTTEQDIFALSEDIASVLIGRTPRVRYAYIEFTSEEKAVKNWRILRGKLNTRYVHPKFSRAEDRDNRLLRLHNIEPSVTREKALGLSKHIIDATINNCKTGGKLVFLEFASEDEAVRAYRVWKRKGLDVKYVGNKNREHFLRTLYLTNLSNDVTKRDLLQLSDDVIDVQIVESKRDRYAFLEFESEKVTERNYAQLKQSLGRSLQYRLGEGKKRKLLLFDVEETEDSLGSLSDSIVEASLSSAGRTAFLDCGTKQGTIDTYNKLIDSGRNVRFEALDYWMRVLWADIHDPLITVPEIQRIVQGVKCVDVHWDKRKALLEFDTLEDLDRSFEKCMASSVTKRISLKKIVEDDASGVNSQLWIGDIVDKNQLESVLPEDCKKVTFRQDFTGKLFAFVDFNSREAAENGLDHLVKLGYVVDWSDEKVVYDHKRCLLLLFDQPDVTKEDVMALSKDIKRIVRLKFRKYFNKTEALVEFYSETIAERNFHSMRDKEDGLLIYYVGQKGRQYIRELDERTVKIHFPNVNVTKEDIQELSPDVNSIKLIRETNNSLAVLEFTSRDQAERNFMEFKTLGLRASYKGY